MAEASSWRPDIVDEPTRVTLSGSIGSTDAAAVWAGFTDPARLVEWWPQRAEVDLRVGGAYSLEWPQQQWILRGVYTTVEPPRRLAFTWSWDHDTTRERLVEVFIAEGGDMLTIRHEHGEQDERDSYVAGWEYFIGRLIELLR